MPSDKEKTVSTVLKAVAKGDTEAGRDLLPLVYKELKALAQARLRALPPGQTLQPTALVHEAYLHVVGADDPGWNSKGHFFGAAAQAMRNILVDQARRKMSQKRGGGNVRVSYEQAEPMFEAPTGDILAVDEALKRLEEEDPRKGQIVNLRYFARMSTSETAAALGISVATVVREWRYIRAWLVRELKKEDPI
ncbi:MAG: sigma-70 family RNA polymerase sigma factor [Planctomycetota bacterium]